MIYREYEIEPSRWVAIVARSVSTRRRGASVPLTPSVKVSSLPLPTGGFFF
jgi:hypothetical protein